MKLGKRELYNAADLVLAQERLTPAD